MRENLLLRGGSAAPETAAAAAAAAPPEVSRVIVFTNLRESVHSICELLAQHAPHVSAKCAPGSDMFWALSSLPTSIACILGASVQHILLFGAQGTSTGGQPARDTVPLY